MAKLEFRRTFNDFISMSDAEVDDFFIKLENLIVDSATKYSMVDVNMYQGTSTVQNMIIKESLKYGVMLVNFDGCKVNITFENYSLSEIKWRIRTTTDSSFNVKETVGELKRLVMALRDDVKAKKEINKNIMKHFFSINK